MGYLRNSGSVSLLSAQGRLQVSQTARSPPGHPKTSRMGTYRAPQILLQIHEALGQHSLGQYGRLGIIKEEWPT